jgi:nitroimidazol reductase NimA-like FMN-containing flavoprotein (pyridoxamine 5'-phosphate oxidase superfamily)
MSDIPADVVELLDGATVMAHLATSVDDRPHVAPVWYRYEDGVIEVVTTGRKLENIRSNPRVALSVQRDIDGETQWFVTALGTATVVDDEAATQAAARAINDKYGAPEDAWPENELVRIELASATARRY